MKLNRFRVFIGPSLLALLASCSFVLGDNVEQCANDGDCTSRPDLLGYVCGPEGVCVTSASFCTTNQQCRERNDGKPFVCNPVARVCEEGCAAFEDGTKSANQHCQEANPSTPFICGKDNKCVAGCAASADGSKTANQVCADANPTEPFLCRDSVCVSGCAAAPWAKPPKTANEVCVASKNDPSYICKNEQCVQGCAPSADGTKSANQVCIDLNKGQPFICVNDVCVPGCEFNATCIDANGGKPFQCRKDTKQCQPLLKADSCFEVLSLKPDNSDIRNDDTLFVPIIASIGGTAGLIGQVEGVEQARLEWMGNGGGLQMGTKKRPVALVVCDNTANIAAATAAFVKDVIGAPAIFGPLNSTVFATLGPSVFVPAKTLMIAGAPGGASLGPILAASMGYMWRTVPSDDTQPQALIKYFPDTLEPQIKTKWGLPAGAATTLKFALAFAGDGTGLAHQSFINANVKFNGLSTAANGTNYTAINYGDGAVLTPAEFTAKQTQAVADLIAFKPHIIFFGGRSEAYTMEKNIEAGWTEPSYRPYYIYERANFGAAGSTMLNTLASATRDELRTRMFGVAPTSTNPADLTLFDQRFNSYWFPSAAGAIEHKLWPVNPATGLPRKSTGSNLFTAGGYDSAYVMFSAMVATRKENPTGTEISAAILKTQPTKPPAAVAPVLKAHPDSLVAITAGLAAGNNVDLNGVYSNLNFDATNSIRNDVVFYCWPKAAAPGGNIPAPIQSDYKFDPNTDLYKGTPPDAAGFFPAGNVTGGNSPGCPP